MKKQIIAIVAAIGISLASAAPAKAWWMGYGGGYGWGGGWGYGGAMLGAGLVGGLIGGAIAGSAYGYGPYYGGYGYYAPTYYYPQYAYPPRQRIKKNVIIKNSPGATVIEEDDFGW